MNVKASNQLAMAGDLLVARGRPKVVPLLRPRIAPALSLRDIGRLALPRPGLPREVNRWRAANWPAIRRSAWRYQLAAKASAISGYPFLCGALSLKVLHASGEEVDYGLASLRVVTNAGVAFLVNAWQNIVEMESLKFHGVGTGTNAEAAGDTALQTELTTQYNPDNTRATGSLGETAANVFQTVATNTFDASVAATEHGLFSQAATGGGTLWDRTVYAVQNFASGEAQQATYSMTATAGG